VADPFGQTLLEPADLGTVLTGFLIWPLLLAWLMIYWAASVTMIFYLAIILMTCLTTTSLGMFSSLLFRRTSTSLVTAYLAVIVLFAAPIAVKLFADLFYPGHALTLALRGGLFVSPFAAAFSLPLAGVSEAADAAVEWSGTTGLCFLGFYAIVDLALIGSMIRLFNRRWRVI
jgi:hypothetical protein